MQKIFFIICDGLPDRPIAELGYKTPLEAAKTPNLDKIAVDGISGMMHVIDVGVRPGSDTAHLSLFGYDPYAYYSGRGIFECAGIGMEVLPGDIAFRANAGTINDQGLVINRRAGRIESTKPVADLLNGTEIDGVKFLLKESLSHRIGLIARGKNLSPQVSKQDPKQIDVLPLVVKPLDDSSQAKFTAEVLNKFTQLTIDKLKSLPINEERIKAGKLPANIILFRGASWLPENILSFEEKYRLKAAFVGGAPMYRGVAKVLGMDVIEFDQNSGVTGLPNTNVEAKIKKALAIAPDYDFIFIHIKGADTLAEDGNYQGKVEFIEKIDKAMKPLADPNDFLVVVTADHTTSSQLKIHTADPVPVTIKGEGVRTDDINAYSERECAKGRMGQIRGENLMPIIIDLMGLAEMYGA
ncbi:MAG: 2,3-bisphosphoglycerate-independent phosphoglycerate mutase [Patescibacteria group bacterium]|jgi:2,3-bisphosphoglycerate-independent phosphoglycerate mutase